jgi:very-short-patch-repair endonuclease
MLQFSGSGQFIKGHIPWNKGRKGVQKAWNKGLHIKLSNSLEKWRANGGTPVKKGINNVKCICKGCSKVFYPPDFVKRMYCSKKCKQENYVNPNKGKPNLKLRGRKMSKESIRKSLRRRSMSSLEIKFQKIITQYNLPYKFVGNGEFFIERKNPDFVNINGEKKAIEVYYKKHKEQFRNMTIDEWKEERKFVFNKYGWEVLFLDETQVNENYILLILGGNH